jgi:hypothetical protein
VKYPWFRGRNSVTGGVLMPKEKAGIRLVECEGCKTLRAELLKVRDEIRSVRHINIIFWNTFEKVKKENLALRKALKRRGVSSEQIALPKV